MLPRYVALIVFCWIAALVTGGRGAAVGPPAPAATPVAAAAAGTARDLGAAHDPLPALAGVP